MSRPTLHITNFSSRKLHHGRVFTIMALPRRWEHGEGVVGDLLPYAEWVREAKAGRLSMEDYRRAYTNLLGQRSRRLAPGELWSTVGAVQDGDTVCCACAKTEALAGRCHRTWCARVLAEAGWRVVLDGFELVQEVQP